MRNPTKEGSRLRFARCAFASALLTLALASPPVFAGAAGFALAVAERGQAPRRARFAKPGVAPVWEPLTAETRAPLGSVWKLFVAYDLLARGVEPPRYACRGVHPEEIFCCPPGGVIGFDDALAKSCGLYFDPERVGVDPIAWARAWRERLGEGYAWLADLSRLKPATEVPVVELLGALGRLAADAAARPRLDRALARVSIDGTAKGAIRKLGAAFRVKTFTWDAPAGGQRFVGGFAGWFADGTPVWGRGEGSSAHVLAEWAGDLARLAGERTVRAAGRATAETGARDSCVDVRFFARYPIREVVRRADGGMIARFERGTAVTIESGAGLVWDSARREIRGRLGVNEYVARVLDREAGTAPREAARAFGIAIRTYLVANARTRGGCYAIDDSTRTQRVSPNSASPAAREIAAWSDRLVLENAPFLRYRRDETRGAVLGWKSAVRAANEGAFADQILRAVYPASRLALAGSPAAEECRPVPLADRWIRARKREWDARLAGMAGYEAPARFRVCESATPQPFSDFERNVIYLRYGGGTEDQLTAAHEYLHLAFKSHPRGHEERFIEEKARALVLQNASIERNEE